MAVLTQAIANQLVEEQGKSIIIPSSFTSIEDYAFAWNELTSVVIPDGVTSIGERAFAGSKLTSVVIPDSVNSIGEDAFAWNELTSVVIPDGVTSIGGETFRENQLMSVVIPDSVTSIGKEAFTENKLTKVVIPDGVTSIGEAAFAENELTSVTIGESVTLIDDNAFAENKLKSIIIPDNVALIGDKAFGDNPLKTVNIASDAIFDANSFYVPGVKFVRRDPIIINRVESIADITTPDNVSTFKLKKSIAVGNQNIKELIVGTDKKDEITGTSKGEVLAGGKGKDVLKGGLGSDGFLFQEPDAFGKKQADTITDFDSDEGDSILVDKDVFDLGKNLNLKIVNSKRESKKATKTKFNFVYDEKKGLLYFNENGKEKGWGDGGLMAKFQSAPEFDASDFTIV